MITLTVDVGGAVHKIETVAASIEDLRAPLAAWNKWYRAKVQQKFDEGGPGWPPTQKQASGAQKSTGDEAVKQLADEMLRRKLQRDVRRASKRYAGGSGSAKALARRYAVLKEFERVAAGGQPVAQLSLDKRLEKSVAGLRARHERATTKAQGRPLGRIASSIKSKMTKSDVTVFSEIPWAGVHNKGGTVGRGSKLPARPFLTIDEEDLKTLVRLIEEHVRFSI